MILKKRQSLATVLVFLILAGIPSPVQAKVGLGLSAPSEITIREAELLDLGAVYNTGDENYTVRVIWTQTAGNITLSVYEPEIFMENGTVKSLYFTTDGIGWCNGMFSVQPMIENTMNTTGGIVIPAFDNPLNLTIITVEEWERRHPQPVEPEPVEPELEIPVEDPETDHIDPIGIPDRDPVINATWKLPINVTGVGDIGNHTPPTPVDGSVKDPDTPDDPKGGRVIGMLIVGTLVGGSIGGAMLYQDGILVKKFKPVILEYIEKIKPIVTEQVANLKEQTKKLKALIEKELEKLTKNDETENPTLTDPAPAES